MKSTRNRRQVGRRLFMAAVLDEGATHAGSYGPIQGRQQGAFHCLESKGGGKQRVRFGFCQLTGELGQFVKSHIIPQALMLGVKDGEPLVQYGATSRPSRKWTSWYDAALVTRTGEDILADLDTWAISELRNQRLVWSGWGDDGALVDHRPINNVFGVREVSLDTEKLRLFFLSLLWRAGANRMLEFQEIDPPASHLEIIRAALLGRGMPEIDFYPVQVTQISTKGDVHNHAPIRATKYIPNLDAPNDGGVLFRFCTSTSMA